MNNYNKNQRNQRKKAYKRPYMDNKRDAQRKANKAHKIYKQRLVRGHLYDYLHQRVSVSGDFDHICLTTTMDNNKPVLFTDCVVCGKHYEQHFWIKLDQETREKLLLAPGKTRVFFEGTLHTYKSRNEHESAKIGIKDIQLVKEI